MWRAVFFGLFVLVIAGPPATSQTKAGQPKTAPKQVKSQKKGPPQSLTLRQIEDLVRNKVPDDVIAGEVRNRGTGAGVTKEFVALIQRIGAGPSTIQAIQALIPRSSLVIRTSPNAAVSVTNAFNGVANADGTVRIADLEPGTYSVTLQKPQFKTITKALDLPPNKETLFESLLEWAVGFVTVEPPTPGVQLALDGTARGAGAIQRLPVSVGEHLVTATLRFYRKAEIRLDVRGGAVSTWRPTLELDREALAAVKSTAKQNYVAGQCESALPLANTLLRYIPSDSDLLQIALACAIKTRAFDGFDELAQKALRSGASAQFPVVHGHSLGRGSHDAEIILTKSGLSFVPLKRCITLPFSVPAGLFRISSGGEFLLSIRFQDMENPKKEHTFGMGADSSLIPHITQLGNLVGRGTLMPPARLKELPSPALPDALYANVNGQAVALSREKSKREKSGQIVSYTLLAQPSAVDVASRSPLFVLRLEKTSATGWELFRVQVRDGKRVISIDTTAQSPSVPIRVLTANELIQIEPVTPLDQGQYCMSARNSNDVFCFKVP